MSLKLKAILAGALFILMIGIIIVIVAVNQQSLTIQGNIRFNVSDKNLIIKDISYQTSGGNKTNIKDFTPCYIDDNFYLDLESLNEINHSESVSLYFDIVNTTDKQWKIEDIYLPESLINQGVTVNYSGIVDVNTLIDSDGDGYKDFSDIETAPYNTLILTIIAPSMNEESLVVLDGIVVIIDEYVSSENIVVYSNNTNLGSVAGGGEVKIGQEVTIFANFKGREEADFLGWRIEGRSGLFVSTLPEYTFIFEEDSPKTYCAIFTKPDENLSYSLDTLTGEAELLSCSAGATDIIVPSMIYRGDLPSAYMVTSMFEGDWNDNVFCLTRSTLQSVIIPETLKNIGSYAFDTCVNLTNIIIPSSVTSIGSSAFFECSGLSSLIIPSSVTSIGSSAFFECSGLSSLIIPSSVTSIGSSAFGHCWNLASVRFEDNSQLLSIGEGAFSSCNSLKTIAFGENSKLESIESSAFLNCGSLESILIPSSVISIGDSAFYDCSGLENITVEEGNSVYHSAGNCLIETGSKMLIKGCNNSSIPEDGSVISISDGAFRNCSGLAGITIPASVESIGSAVFQGCINLESVGFGENSQLQEIASLVFSGCSSLTRIILPNGIINIDDFAFSGCSSLMDITIPDSVESIGVQAFDSCSSLTSITIPSSLINIGYAAFISCDALFEVFNYSNNIIVELGSQDNGFLGQYAKVVYNASELETETLESKIRVIDNVQYYVDLEMGEFIALAPAVVKNNLIAVNLNYQATEINNYAFKDCINLESISFADNSQLRKIGEDAFSGCNNLKTVSINEYVYTNMQSETSCGGILKNAEVVYLPQSVVEDENIIMGSYIIENFTQGELANGLYEFIRK